MDEHEYGQFMGMSAVLAALIHALRDTGAVDDHHFKRHLSRAANDFEEKGFPLAAQMVDEWKSLVYDEAPQPSDPE